ncbi:MAG: RloB domain-containing protein [Methylobacter sp.]|nr:RloB domain-containing protein [Methylobacter sp.]
MGTDNLHHKRKAKLANALQRQNANRKPYDKVLIVCEDEKSAVYYFEEVKDYYEINIANIEIDGSCDSAPISVVEHAIKRYKSEAKTDNGFDRVFCVFDKDTHDSYGKAIALCAKQKPKGVFYSIPSVPCFEYWLLLHFKNSTRPYHATSKKSVGDIAFDELQSEFSKNHLSEYSKASRDIFRTLGIERLNDAKRHAERALQEAEKNQTDNPVTYVHELIAYLQGIKDPKSDAAKKLSSSILIF